MTVLGTSNEMSSF